MMTIEVLQEMYQMCFTPETIAQLEQMFQMCLM